MSEAPPESHEEDVMLAQTARMDFAFARHVQERALASDDPKELCELARAYARLTRSLRQDLALLSRQKADREKARRERALHDAITGPPERDLRELALDERTTEVQQAVDRVISAAADGDTRLHTDWVHRFDRELDDWTETPDWLDDDVDAVIARVCKTLGLPEDYAARWRELPEPTFYPEPEPRTPEQIAAANAARRELTPQLRAGTKPTYPPPYDKYDNSG